MRERKGNLKNGQFVNCSYFVGVQPLFKAERIYYDTTRVSLM